MKHPQRISFLVRHLKSSGISLVIINLINSLIKYDFLIDLVILDIGESPYLSEISKDVRIIDLTMPISGSNLRNPFQLIISISNYLREQKPDILFANIWLYNVLVIFAKILGNRSTKIIIIEHDHLLINLKNSSPSNIKKQPILNKALPFLVTYFYPFADNVIAVSRSLATELEQVFHFKKGQIKTIYNPIFNEKIREKSEELMDHPWFKEGEPPVILGVGRLAKEKDFATLIRSIALVRKSKDVRLMILGEGIERKNLENLVKELGLENQVLMPGFVINPYAYMSKASVFVLSSTREGLSNVLIEAMTCNIPIVSTNAKGGVLEVLANGKYGEIVPVGHYQAMANTIIRVLELEGNNKTFDLSWLQQFSIENITKEYIEIINLNSKSPSKITD
ncbi:MAG: glycosyltransferase [Cyanobacterium sp. T60_A2020_053]|nr:glycosyltransferase [Cyanobacterium sp. T60_A2020_053]